MKILIIQQKMIGDVLTSSVLFEVLKEEINECELHYLINSHTYPVVENHPFIDDFIFFTPEIEKSYLKLVSLIKQIRKNKYDVVIDVYGKLSSNLITLFSGANKKISKHKSYTSFLYNYTLKDSKIAKTKSGIALENRLQYLTPLNLSIKNIPKPKIYVKEAEIKAAQLFLTSNGIDLSKPLFMISVLGSNKLKTYPFGYMAKVIDSIVETTHGQILFNYIPKQEKEAKAIFNLCNEANKKHIFFEVFGKNLRDFLALTKHCDALIGNEGGATNMAKALNVPTFTIFSPWIKKEVWSLFEDDIQNVSVHLKDYAPEFFNNKNTKELKTNWKELYDQFKPSLFKNKLKNFFDH